MPADKRAKQLQDFFNRLKLTAKDLDSSTALDMLKEQGMLDMDYYQWVQQYTSISNDRLQRYKDYESMIQVPELELGLSTYADDGTQMNDEGRVVKIITPDDNIKQILETTFFDNLDMNADLWKIFFGTCQYGDNFYEIIPDFKKKEIVSIKYLHPSRVERIEVDGNLISFIVRKKPPSEIDRTTGVTKFAALEGKEKDVVLMQPWEIVHFKIDDNIFAPYGRSVLESGRRTYKQLSLMEDAMLIYRLERAPEKRVFYIDVGNLSTAEAEKFVERIKAKFRKQRYIDPVTKQINEKATPLSILEDIYIPVRSGVANSQGTRIDILQGGRQLNEIDDTKYFRDKLLKTMHIPPQYLSGEGGMDTRNALSQMDIKFARTVERIQRHIVKGLDKIAIVALALKGYKNEELQNFRIELTPPSNIAEMLEIETLNSKINLISSILSIEGLLSKQWIYKKILNFSDREIEEIKTQLQLEYTSPLQQLISGGGAPAPMPTAPPVAGGIGELPGAEAGAAPPAGGEEATPPPEETAAAPAETAPEAGAPAPGPEVASNIITIDNKQFIVENAQHIAKIIKYLNEKRKPAKDNNTKENKDRKVIRKGTGNSFKRQAIIGELRGLRKSIKKE